MHSLTTVCLYLAVGTACGYIGHRLEVTGGVIVCAMLGVLTLRIVLNHDVPLPKSFQFGVQVLVGVMVGATYSPSMAKVFPKIILPVISSTMVLVIAGLLVGLVLNKIGILDISTSYLGTSPGGMAALVALATDADANPTVVAVFHFFRLVFILVTAPLVFHLWQIWFNKPPH
jgi:membrane AbrB-like protein